MGLIGENIHIISPAIKNAIAEKNENFILNLAKRQIEAGIKIIDLNIGPAKGPVAGAMEWLVSLVQNNFDVDFSLDTTNLIELEKGLKCIKNPENSFLNSTSAEPIKLDNATTLASKYNCNLIALTMNNSSGIPKTAEERLELAYEMACVANEKGIENSKIYVDPLVLPVCVDQNQASITLNSIRMFKESFDPEIKTVIGLSNISNGCKNEFRALINRTFLTLALGAGLDCAIIDALDNETIEMYNKIKSSDSGLLEIYFSLFEMSKNFGELEDITFDKDDIEQVKIYKTAQILLNKEIYTHSFI